MNIKKITTVFALTLATLWAAPAYAGKTVWEEGDAKLALGGDMRFRYESDHNERTGKADRDRDRARIRLRMNTKFTANENVEMGAQLATNADDLHSRHYNLGFVNDGTAPSTWGVDKGYIQFNFKPAFIWFGKNANIVWDPMQLTWDSDLNPEGVAAAATFGDDVQIWAGLAYYMLSESMWDAKDDTALGGQVGVKTKGDFAFTAAAGFYSLNDQDEDNADGLSVPGGKATYIHGMAEAAMKDAPLSPALGVGYVTSDVADKYIGTGSKSSDKTALVVYLGGKLGVVKAKVSYWDVGVAGATAMGAVSQDDFPNSSNFTGFSASLGTKLLDMVDADIKYYSQEVKNADISPSFTSGVMTGKGNKHNRIQLNLNVKF